MPKVECQLNLSVVAGNLVGIPIARELDNGQTVVNLSIRVKPEDTAAQTVPISWINPPDWVLELSAGQAVLAVGQTRQVWFGKQQRFTDVLVETLVKISGPASVRRTLSEAMAAIELQVP